LGARARDRWRRLELLGRGGARVTVDSFDVGLEVFVCSSRNFSAKLCEWLAEVGRELADLV
jgi:hypothetical protein